MVLGLKGRGAAREGLAAIAPIVETQSQAFGDLAQAVGRKHLGACEQAEREPDSTLARIMHQS
jgi:hypothetical protein